ncbi:hypothetical protein [Patulibacter minatonensis]|uniref:hypothetical protein n=1 Tax=Patulibacter minatonensis TaxID=298163 RepID=UPI00047A0811|nr:hypothetical protein [Patulibacter minatonensis]
MRRRALLAATLAVSAASLVPLAGSAAAEVIGPNCSPPGGYYSGGVHPGACWRPFSADSPFNVRLLPNDPRVEPASDRIVNRLNAMGRPGSLSFGTGQNGKGFGEKAIYFARPTDPQVTVRLREDDRNGGTWGRSELNGMTIRIPAGARPSQGTDGHLAVVDQESGWVYELWQADDAGARNGAISASWGGRTRIDGTGETIGTGVASASGLSILGGIIRPEELLEGEIPHALYLTVGCTNGISVAPSLRPTSDPASSCARQGKSNVDAPALGQRFQLGYTDAQIDALPVPNHAKVLLRAMSRYGMIVTDLSGGDSWHLDAEASLDRSSLGQPDPGVEFGQLSGLPTWDGGRQYLWEIADIPGIDGKAGSWTKALRVIKPCVSDGSCPAPAPAPQAVFGPVVPDAVSLVATTKATPTSVTATATATATVAVRRPVPARATATATVKASAVIKRPKSKTTSSLKKARTDARVKAKKKATRRAKVKALHRARARAAAKARAKRLKQLRAADVAK